MKIKCLIVDDEALARQIVRKYLEDLSEFEIIKECKNAIEAIDCLNNNTIDLIFLDINMPKLSGLSFLKTLNNPPAVIITTAYREYAIDGYELDIIDYLSKPFSFERFLKAINKAKKRISYTLIKQPNIKTITNSIKDFVFIKADKKTHKIDYKNILFIEGMGDYIKIITKNKTIITYMSLKKIEEILPNAFFPRIHKSYIISLSKIISIEGNTVRIGETTITIGGSYRKSFFELIQSHSI